MVRRDSLSGCFIVRASHFVCNTHPIKVKFFKSLNAILAKIGSSTDVTLTLKLVTTNCYPILMHGMDACRLTKAQMVSLAHPYSAVFFKLFRTFDKKIIRQTQYYTGHLPYAYALALMKIKFFLNLAAYSESPAGTLFRWMGGDELTEIQLLYGLLPGVGPGRVKDLLWTHFQKLCESEV